MDRGHELDRDRLDIDAPVREEAIRVRVVDEPGDLAIGQDKQRAPPVLPRNAAEEARRHDPGTLDRVEDALVGIEQIPKPTDEPQG